MKNQSKARVAGLTGMAGAMLFTFYFIGINPFLNLFSTPFSPGSTIPMQMKAPCLTYLPLPVATKNLARLNPSIYTIGPTFYIVESIFNYNFSERAWQHVFTLIGLSRADYRESGY
jgi:hypothetical protein